MRQKTFEDPATRLAKAQRQNRSNAIRAGSIEGLFEKGGHILRPEVRALIDAALAEKMSKAPVDESCVNASDARA